MKSDTRLQQLYEREHKRYTRQRLRHKERLYKYKEYNNLLDSLIIYDYYNNEQMQTINHCYKLTDTKKDVNNNLFNMVISHVLGINTCKYVTILETWVN